MNYAPALKLFVRGGSFDVEIRDSNDFCTPL